MNNLTHDFQGYEVFAANPVNSLFTGRFSDSDSFYSRRLETLGTSSEFFTDGSLAVRLGELGAVGLYI